MRGYPLVLDGATLSAVVVGGGAVATRKVRALLDAGAAVRVVAPRMSAELRALAAASARLTLVERAYRPGDVGDATLVIAAADSRAVNRAVACDGRAARRLVNVADAPREGNCVTVAAHRAGDLLVAVFAGGVPGAAARVRDAIAARFDDRYARALRALGELRARLRAAGGGEAWRGAASQLVGDDFCASVESGTFAERVARWH